MIYSKTVHQDTGLSLRPYCLTIPYVWFCDEAFFVIIAKQTSPVVVAEATRLPATLHGSSGDSTFLVLHQQWFIHVELNSPLSSLYADRKQYKCSAVVCYNIQEFKTRPSLYIIERAAAPVHMKKRHAVAYNLQIIFAVIYITLPSAEQFISFSASKDVRIQ